MSTLTFNNPIQKELAVLLCDFYKLSHRPQYPVGTRFVYDTLIPRKGLFEGMDEVVVWAVQMVVKEYIVDYFNEHFFNQPIESILERYVRTLKYTLGMDEVETEHLESLHALGYLPIKIKAVPEGTVIPVGTPLLTIENTHPDHFWLTNFLETMICAELWQPVTSASIAREYRKILNKYAMETIGSTDGVEFQGHDFSFRGMEGVPGAEKSGTGHLLSFVGTDTVPSINRLEQYYFADIEKETVGTSIPATEHSVMCAHGLDEVASFRHIIKNVHPKGFVSIVADTWDFWNVIGHVLPEIKEEIMGRDGRVVIRPDSGVPEDIVCGTIKTFFSSQKEAEQSSYVGKAFIKETASYVEISESGVATNYEPTLEEQGLIVSLWNLFGGTVNHLGYKVLDTHIGAIYGDSITRPRAEEILSRLKELGFVSTSIVFGIGAYTYQLVTRDVYGIATKATYVEVGTEERMIFKEPKTDASKKSLRGRVVVYEENGEIKYKDGFLRESEKDFELSVDSLLETVFEDGEIKRIHTLKEVRERLSQSM